MIVEYTGCDDVQVRWGSNDDPRDVLYICGRYEVLGVEVHTWHSRDEERRHQELLEATRKARTGSKKI